LVCRIGFAVACNSADPEMAPVLIDNQPLAGNFDPVAYSPGLSKRADDSASRNDQMPVLVHVPKHFTHNGSIDVRTFDRVYQSTRNEGPGRQPGLRTHSL